MKVKVSFIIFLVLISAATILAQKNLNPPAAIIYSAPKAVLIKDFASPDKKFKAAFPGIPIVENFDGKGYSSTVYMVLLNGSNEVVNVIQYSENAEANMDKILANTRETIANSSGTIYNGTVEKAKITEEKDIQVGNFKGKQFSYELGLENHKVRFVFNKETVYEIRTSVTNWHMLKEMNKPKAAEFEKESERFFNSFQIIN